MTPLFSNALLRTQSDERLVRLARDGHERAFEVIVVRYRRPLQRYCERTLSKSRAEDVVQQTLTKAWLALRDGTEVRMLRPWLYRIAWTTALETARVPGFDYEELQRSLQAPAGPEAELDQQAVIRKTLAGLAALPPAQREALLRDAFEGQSRAQIAEALGVTEGAVRQLLHRARASLRAAATAITPLPFANWLVTAGSGSVAAPAVEGAAAGSIGIAGLAKTSAILATAGVVATGSGGVKDPDEVRSEPPRKAKVFVHRPSTVAATQSVRVHSAKPVARRERGDSEQTNESEHGKREERRGQEGESGESPRAGGDEREVARPESRGRDDPQHEEERSGRSRDRDHRERSGPSHGGDDGDEQESESSDQGRDSEG